MRRTAGFIALGVLAAVFLPYSLWGQEDLRDANVTARSSGDAGDPSLEYDEALRRYYNEAGDDKIFGGTPADRGEFPWQVSLGVSWVADTGLAHFCGGTIYRAQWIITAGHCVGGRTAEQIAVAYGSNILGIGNKRVNVAKIIRHKNYRWHPDYIENDIALLKLRDPIPLGTTAKAVQLLTDDEAAALVHNRTELVVTGWGRTQIDGGNVVNLRKVKVKFMGREQCSSPLSYGSRIDGGMLCAGVDAGGKDTCKGDSGGPLVWRSREGGERLAGVVSFGEGCAQVLKWGVYARVPTYADWVVQNAV